MKTIDVIAAVLLVVGGLNWGLVAVMDYDLVAALFGLSFGETGILSKMVYGLVGCAAVYQAFALRHIQQRWGMTQALPA